MPDSIDSGGSPRVALSSGSGNALFSDEPPSTSDAETADVAPAARREPSAFYIPSKDAALIDYGDERLDKREALRRLEEHLEHLESGIQESFEDLEGRLARLRDDGSSRVLPEVRDERAGLYRAVTQPGLEVQHATSEAGLEVASVFTTATDAVVSAAGAIGSALSTAATAPVEHLKSVPAVKNIGDSFSQLIEQTGQTLKPVTDAVAAAGDGTARFFGLKETNATVYSQVPPTIPHVTRIAAPANANNNFDSAAAPPDFAEKPVKYVGYAAPVKGLTENSVEWQEKLAQKWEGRDARSVPPSDVGEGDDEGVEFHR